MSRHRLSIVLALVYAVSAAPAADSLVTKDGQTITGKSYRRKDDTILVTLEIPGPDGKPMTAEKGILMTEITKVECQQPAILKDAPELLAKGQVGQVLQSVREAAEDVEPFGDLPGSPWPDLVVLQSEILIALGKDAEASTLVAPIERSSDNNVKTSAATIRALVYARKGDHERAASLISPVLADEDAKDANGSALAAAYLTRGLALLDKKEWIPALKMFLSLPVFEPDETAYNAIVMLGSAKAYFGMEDYDRAIATLKELIKAYPSSPEAGLAPPLLTEYERRQRVVKEAKD